MLLAADAYADDFRTTIAEFLENLTDRGFDRGDPDRRILFHGALSLCLNKAVSLLSAGEDLSGRRVEGDGFGALGSAIDA